MFVVTNFTKNLYYFETMFDLCFYSSAKQNVRKTKSLYPISHANEIGCIFKMIRKKMNSVTIKWNSAALSYILRSNRTAFVWVKDIKLVT